MPDHQLSNALLLQDGMFVTFSEVEGMAELNDGKPRRVQNVKVGALLQTLSLILMGASSRNICMSAWEQRPR